jgi:hypothetical protein
MNFEERDTSPKIAFFAILGEAGRGWGKANLRRFSIPVFKVK